MWQRGRTHSIKHQQHATECSTIVAALACALAYIAMRILYFQSFFGGTSLLWCDKTSSKTIKKIVPTMIRAVLPAVFELAEIVLHSLSRML